MKIIRAMSKFKDVANNDVFVIPNNGIIKNPAAMLPRAAPSELNE